MRVGVVGAGTMGAVHADAWHRLGADLVAVAAEPGVPPTELAARVGARACLDLDELLAHVDVVDVCVPTHLHAEVTLRAAAAGRHVICEKPLARTSGQARRMLAACREAGVGLLVAHVVRFFPEYVAAREQVRRGAIGTPAVLRFSRTTFAPRRRADDWFADPVRSGGVLLDLMVHDLDQARWFAGEVATVSAFGLAARRPELGVDHVLAVLTHVGGAISHLEASWAHPAPGFRTRFEVAGTTGLIDHDSDRDAPLRLTLPPAQVEAPPVPVATSPLAESPYQRQLAHLLGVLEGTASPVVTAEDGLAALLLAEAAERSIMSGQPEPVTALSAGPA